TNQPTKPKTENQAATKVLLGIAKAVGKTAVKAATSNNKNNGSVLDTLGNLPTDNQSGNGGGGGGNDAMSGLVNSFSGMMSNNAYNPTAGFGGGFQQPDFSSLYQNIMNQYQQLQFQLQQGQSSTSPESHQIMMQMQQLQQQMAQLQMQQQQ